MPTNSVDPSGPFLTQERPREAAVALLHQGPELVTLRGVEILRLGTWPASTGRTRITDEDFAAMLAAASDPEVPSGVLRIGHRDPRFDGEPAIGRVANLRRDGDRLVGDLENVPRMFADILPAAWPNRSAEVSWGWKTTAGKVYRAALTGLALLGVQPPAVKGLADVIARYAEATASEVGATGGVSVLGIAPQPDEASQTPPDDSAPGGPPVNEARIRELLQLEADADIDAAVDAAIAERGQTPPAATPSTDTPAPAPAASAAPAPAASTGEPTSGGEPTPEPATPAPPAGVVQISEGVLNELRQQAAAGAAAAETLQTQDNERVLTAALAEGRIAPTERDAFRSQLSENPTGTRTLLSALTPGRVPVSEIGADAGTETTQLADDAAFEAFEHEFLGVPTAAQVEERG